MKKQSVKLWAVLALACMSVVSCKKDKEEINEEEVITTMRLSFAPQGGGSAAIYQFDDPDGPGGNNPTQDEIILAPGKVYNVTVQLLNKTENPAGDITEEVMEEAEAHRFYYLPATGSNITVNGLNNDADGIPLGITSVWTTGTAVTGKIKVILRHYPGNPPGEAAADAADDPKSGTDIEVEFNTRIQ